MTALGSTVGTLLAALAATGALWFTGQSLHATNTQLGMAQQTAVTDRFRLAAEQLSSDKINVRIAGIYLFERLAQDSPADHATVYSVLAAFVRTQAPKETCNLTPKRSTAPADIQVAMTVILRRDTSREQPANHPDLTRTCLAYTDLSGVNLTTVNLAGADLSSANLKHTNLSGANLDLTILAYANLSGANLAGTTLHGNLSYASLSDADLTHADLSVASLSNAALFNANLSHAQLSAARLDSAGLIGANLTSADLTSATLDSADLIGANLTGANLTDAKLDNIWYDARTHWPESFTPPPMR